MSSRQLKKLRKQQDLLSLQKEAAGNEENTTSEDEPANFEPRPSAFVGFAALAGDDGNDDNDDEAQEEEEVEVAQDHEQEPTPKTPATSKKSKKSKKKKKAKKTAASHGPDGTTESKDDGLDEIDLALKELKMPLPAPNSGVESTGIEYSATLARLLSINFQHLKMMNEMRALFGQETIDSVRASDEAQAQADRRRQRHGRLVSADLETFLKGVPGQKLSDVVLKKNPFIQGRDTWPRASAGGLSMVAVTDDRVDPTEYAFTHDKTYQRIEMQFYCYVDMMDPMKLVHFSHQNPYHVAGLTQVSKVAKQDQNSALAAELCERALFTFGRITLSSFRRKLEKGLARLSFARPENRQFWLAGYLYIKSLIQKGTYRTALEWTKLYLSISPNKDEYGMMNFAHVLAIKSHQARWFIDLCDSDFFASDEYDYPMRVYHKQTRVLARLQIGDAEGAKKDLVDGMEDLPWLYSAIYSAVNVDTPRSVWGVQPRDDTEALYTELYIHVAKDLWALPNVTSFLKEFGDLARKVTHRTLPPVKVPLSVGRFIYLDNTPSLMGLVPSSMLHASPNFDYDPLPPPLEENVISYEAQEYPWKGNQGGSQEHLPFPLENFQNFANELVRLRRERQAARHHDEGDEEGDDDDDDEDEDEDDEELDDEDVHGAIQRFVGWLWPLRLMGGGREGEDVHVERQADQVDDYGWAVGGNPWADIPEDEDQAAAHNESASQPDRVRDADHGGDSETDGEQVHPAHGARRE